MCHYSGDSVTDRFRQEPRYACPDGPICGCNASFLDLPTLLVSFCNLQQLPYTDSRDRQSKSTSRHPGAVITSSAIHPIRIQISFDINSAWCALGTCFGYPPLIYISHVLRMGAVRVQTFLASKGIIFQWLWPLDSSLASPLGPCSIRSVQITGNACQLFFSIIVPSRAPSSPSQAF